jgi:5-methylcytosine-specific restriction endonuclease McrA
VKKVCNKCKIEKDISEFSPRKDRPCGFDGRCRSCQAKRSLDYYKRNRDVAVVKLRERNKKARQLDPKVSRAHAALGKKHIVKSTPKWVDRKELVNFYYNRPEGMTVDHIIPLRGKNVSGLTVLWNLQYLTPSLNSKKYNRI